MKKTNTFKSLSGTLIFLLWAGIIFAQPTINSDIHPQTGDQWEGYFVEPQNFDPGLSGANVTWDFNNLPTTGGWELNFEILPTASSPANADYPSATFVWFMEEFGYYHYYKGDANELAFLGTVVANPQGEIDFKVLYTDPEEGYQYPMTYPASYEFVSHSISDFNGITFENDYSADCEIDGYGTVITPYGTFENVLRLIITRTDETFNETTVQYNWIQAGSFIPVLVYDIPADPVYDPESLYYSKKIGTSTSVHVVLETASIQVLQNPVQNVLQVDLNVDQGFQTSILSLEDFQGRVVEVLHQGKLQIGGNYFEQKTDHLPAGNYVLKLLTTSGILTKQLILIK